MFKRNAKIGTLETGRKKPASGKSQHNRLLRAVLERYFKSQTRGRTSARASDAMAAESGEMFDVLFGAPGDPCTAEEIFHRLHWGGLMVYVGTNETKVARQAESFTHDAGFVIEQEPTDIWAGAMGLRIPGLTPHGHWFSARKTQLILPSEITERFTYQVELIRDDAQPEGYRVRKSVPTFENIVFRLRKRFPNASQEDIENRARKFVDHVFPTFLTREAAFLKILERDLPPDYRKRVPKLLYCMKDETGFVRTLDMNWLRTGSKPTSQLDFAKQAAELLAIVHDRARIMHLDLRLDNFVLTDDGVGFVDFGSAVRIGEKLSQSSMLNSLFGEMMRTSQIQRMLGRMIDRGDVHNEEMTRAHHKVDKAVDSFYLAVQINHPNRNPEFGHLVKCDKDSDEAKALSALTAAILRPKHPDKNEFKAAMDILRGIRRIEAKLNGQTNDRRVAATAIPFGDRRNSAA